MAEKRKIENRRSERRERPFSLVSFAFFVRLLRRVTERSERRRIGQTISCTKSIHALSF